MKIAIGFKIKDGPWGGGNQFVKSLSNKLLEKGGWPNDAIMCKQFFLNELKVVYPYYTTLLPQQLL